MQHFFIEPSQAEGEWIRLNGSDVNHMKNVLRMHAGERVTVSDGAGKTYQCMIDSYEDKEAVLKIESQEESSTELPSRIYLFQGLPKQEKMEWIVQKSVELGAYQIVPVSMKRCVVKLDAKKAAKKQERWQEISRSAAKQSGRSVIPEVIPVCTFKEALEQAKQLDVILVPYECAEGMKETKTLLEKIWPGQSVGIFIGPEGGTGTGGRRTYDHTGKEDFKNGDSGTYNVVGTYVPFGRMIHKLIVKISRREEHERSLSGQFSNNQSLRQCRKTGCACDVRRLWQSIFSAQKRR